MVTKFVRVDAWRCGSFTFFGLEWHRRGRWFVPWQRNVLRWIDMDISSGLVLWDVWSLRRRGEVYEGVGVWEYD